MYTIWALKNMNQKELSFFLKLGSIVITTKLGFEDSNLTKAVSNNLDKAIKRPQQPSCT